MNDPIEIGARIRRARKRIGMTLKELGRRVGLSESTIWHYEKGDLKSLDVKNITNIAKALGVSPDELLDLNDDPVSDQWGDDEANIEFLKQEPELLKSYLEITRDPQTRVLFDKVSDLKPEEVAQVISVINKITKDK